MFEKLQADYQRFKEVDSALLDPAVSSDPARVASLARERGALAKVAVPYDQYLARLFGVLAGRFHLDVWGRDVRESLSVLESIYHVLADQSATYRAEFLEILINLLIAVELVIALWPW